MFNMLLWCYVLIQATGIVFVPLLWRIFVQEVRREKEAAAALKRKAEFVFRARQKKLDELGHELAAASCQSMLTAPGPIYHDTDSIFILQGRTPPR